MTIAAWDAPYDYIPDSSSYGRSHIIMCAVVLQCILAVPYGLHDTMGVPQVVSSATLCIPSV